MFVTKKASVFHLACVLMLDVKENPQFSRDKIKPFDFEFIGFP